VLQVCDFGLPITAAIKQNVYGEGNEKTGFYKR
jgi:hypothetical protein